MSDLRKTALTAAATKIAAAQPKTAGGVLAVLRGLLPLLPYALGEIIRLDKTGRYKKVMRAIRDQLDGADLD